MPAQTAETWTPLSAPWTAPNGLVVEPLSDHATMWQMGVLLENPLAQHSRTWARACAEGHRQVVRVLDGGGATLSNAELRVVFGRVTVLFHGAYRNGPASPEAEAAVHAYVQAANGGALDLEAEIGPDRFLAPEPVPAPGL